MLIPYHDDAPAPRIPVVTLGIIVMNVVVFLWTASLPPLQQETLDYQWGFIPARIQQLQSQRRLVLMMGQPADLPWAWGAAPRFLILQPKPDEILLTLATCLFLHGSWMHLLGNMWFLWLFGDNVEGRLGHTAFLLFYLLGGLAATLTHWLIFPQSQLPVVGASGAIAAVLGAYAVTWPWARVSTLVFLVIFVTFVQLPALFVLGAWFVLQLIAGVATIHKEAVQSVAWWAHIGGFAAGALLMPLLTDFLAPAEILAPEENAD